MAKRKSTNNIHISIRSLRGKTNKQINFVVWAWDQVTLAFYDSRGSFIKYIYQQRTAKGAHKVNFDVRAYGAGIYYVKAQVGMNRLAKKYVITR